MTKGKDKTPRDMQTNCVYKVECADCFATYVGQTKRRLHIRNYEHQHSPRSVINNHCTSLNHKFEFGKIKVLDIESNTRKRQISEMLEIGLSKNSINQQTDIRKLHTPYCSLFKKMKT